MVHSSFSLGQLPNGLPSRGLEDLQKAVCEGVAIGVEDRAADHAPVGSKEGELGIDLPNGCCVDAAADGSAQVLLQRLHDRNGSGPVTADADSPMGASLPSA